jgi:hypothetical protein
MKVSIIDGRAVVVLVVVLPHILAIWSLESESTLMATTAHLSGDDFLKDPFIEVSATSRHFNIDGYELTHLRFAETGRNKRGTY